MPKQLELSLDDNCIHQLYQTVRLFSKTLNNRISNTGIYGSEWTVIKLLYSHPNMSQQDMINYLQVEGAAISKTLKKLEEKGLIERYKQSGVRGNFIVLSSKGNAAYLEISAQVNLHRQEALQHIDKSKQRQLLELLEEIQRNLQ